jgi:TolB protein
VTTTTTGSNPDADGYAISLDGAAGVAITPAGSHRFSELSPGDHQVELSGLAANCRVEGENPRAVTVVEGSGAAVVFAVVCSEAPTTSSLIAFGSEGLGDAAIFVVRPDGTGLQRLSPEGALDREPVWSPDHGRILFASGDDLYVMNADGSGRAPMVEAQGVSDYRWSPDGRQIAFVSTVFEDDNILDEVWVVQADGSGRLRLATNATTPTWSPDGARLAYVSSLDFSDLHIRVINADGSGDVRLTDESLAAFEPAWSPDGTRIAFVTVDERDIYLINPDGTGLINLTNGVGDDDEPAWSPDGRRLAFNTTPPEQPLESEIAVMNADGTGRTGLTNRPGFDFSPDWSPDGTQLVYHQSGDLDTEIFVMNTDGSGQLNVSNRPNNEESSADWSGGGRAAAAGRQAQAKRLRQAER